MTAQQFISILVRLGGIAVFCALIRTQIPYLVQMLSGRAPLRAEDFVGLTICVMLMTAAAIMTLLPELVAAKVLHGKGREVMSVAWSASELRAALLSSIALWMLFDGAISASYWISYLTAYHTRIEQIPISYPWSPDVVGGIVANIVQLVLGLMVLTNALRIAEWVRGRSVAPTENN